MGQDTFQQTADLIVKDFALQSTADTLTEKELLQLLADQVAYMIDNQLEVLLSLMYRLDVDERKVAAALSPAAPENPNIGIARLVLERQKQRIFTKQHYKQESNWDWDE